MKTRRGGSTSNEQQKGWTPSLSPERKGAVQSQQQRKHAEQSGGNEPLRCRVLARGPGGNPGCCVEDTE